jgi:hypothetical protein
VRGSAGLTLDRYVKLPFNAVPGELEPAVLRRMGLTAGPIMGVSAVISMLVYSRHDLTRERHRAITQEIEQRKAATEVGGGAAEASLSSTMMAQGSTLHGGLQSGSTTLFLEHEF